MKLDSKIKKNPDFQPSITNSSIENKVLDFMKCLVSNKALQNKVFLNIDLHTRWIK